ncbi:hypothetical protein [Kitasatospora sp. NPDC088783]|uniref:hypothetical protein n=1 Tax=Kitasatospora sp. NPDC088783 TaxID=3364077 RepID=UPI00382BD592
MSCPETTARPDLPGALQLGADALNAMVARVPRTSCPVHTAPRGLLAAPFGRIDGQSARSAAARSTAAAAAQGLAAARFGKAGLRPLGAGFGPRLAGTRPAPAALWWAGRC